MHGLVTLLPEPYYKQVESIWIELEEKFGLQGIRVTPYPHFSWQIAGDYNQDKLFNLMEKISLEQTIIKTHTTGLGLFTGDSPVIYIQVVKTPQMMDLHKRIWDLSEKITTMRSPYYAPDNWIPHISIAYEDVNRNTIKGLFEDLAFRDFHWEITIDNLAFIFEPDGKIGDLLNTAKFSGTVEG
jgi:2'-5' RNA ligase